MYNVQCTMTNFQCTSNGALVLGFTDPMARSHRIGLLER